MQPSGSKHAPATVASPGARSRASDGRDGVVITVEPESAPYSIFCRRLCGIFACASSAGSSSFTPYGRAKRYRDGGWRGVLTRQPVRASSLHGCGAKKTCTSSPRHVSRFPRLGCVSESRSSGLRHPSSVSSSGSPNAAMSRRLASSTGVPKATPAKLVSDAATRRGGGGGVAPDGRGADGSQLVKPSLVTRQACSKTPPASPPTGAAHAAIVTERQAATMTRRVCRKGDTTASSASRDEPLPKHQEVPFFMGRPRAAAPSVSRH